MTKRPLKKRGDKLSEQPTRARTERAAETLIKSTQYRPGVIYDEDKRVHLKPGSRSARRQGYFLIFGGLTFVTTAIGSVVFPTDMHRLASVLLGALGALLLFAAYKLIFRKQKVRNGRRKAQSAQIK